MLYLTVSGDTDFICWKPYKTVLSQNELLFEKIINPCTQPLLQDEWYYYYSKHFLIVICTVLCFRGMVYDGNETYYVQPLPGNTNKVSTKPWKKSSSGFKGEGGGLAVVSQALRACQLPLRTTQTELHGTKIKAFHHHRHHNFKDIPWALIKPTTLSWSWTLDHNISVIDIYI